MKLKLVPYFLSPVFAVQLSVQHVMPVLHLQETVVTKHVTIDAEGFERQEVAWVKDAAEIDAEGFEQQEVAWVKDAAEIE